MISSASFPLEFHQAVERLLGHARRDSGQSRRCADFLLAWFNGKDNGGIDPADVWYCDKQIREDMITVFMHILRVPVDPVNIGYGRAFADLWRQWRSNDPPPAAERESPFAQDHDSIFMGGSGGDMLRRIVMSLYHGDTYPVPLHRITSLDRENMRWVIRMLQSYYELGERDKAFLDLARAIQAREVVRPWEGPATMSRSPR